MSVLKAAKIVKEKNKVISALFAKDEVVRNQKSYPQRM